MTIYGHVQHLTIRWAFLMFPSAKVLALAWALKLAIARSVVATHHIDKSICLVPSLPDLKAGLF